jgi:hypothetical protein
VRYLDELPPEQIGIVQSLNEELTQYNKDQNRTHEREMDAMVGRGMRFVGGLGAVAAGVGALFTKNKWLGMAAAAIGAVIGLDMLGERGRNERLDADPNAPVNYFGEQGAGVGAIYQDIWAGLQSLFKQRDGQQRTN